MKLLLLIASLLFYITQTFGQSFFFTNHSLVGNTSADDLNKVIQTSDGGKLMIFSSENTGGDRLSTNYGNIDFWIVKLNSLHAIEWEKSYGGSFQDSPLSAVELADGSFVIGGISNSMPDSGTRTLPTYSNSDYWVIKISSTGSLIWDKSFGSDGYDYLFSISLKNDTLLLVGTSDGEISGSKTIDNYGFRNIWLVAIDTAGNELFQRVYGGSMEENFPTSKVLDDKLIILCRTSSGISGNKASPNYGTTDAWIIKLDDSYDIYQENTFGGIYLDYFNDLVLNNGNYYCVGASLSPTGGTKTSPKYGNMDAWVVKLDMNLNNVEQSSYGGVGSYFFTNIINRPNEKLLLAGSSTDGIGTWKSRPSMGENDFYVIGLNENGIYEWNYSWGGSYSDIATQIFESQNNSFQIFGTSKSSASGDVWAINHDINGNKTDGYWCTFTTNLSISETAQKEIKVFPNPFIDFITLQSDQLTGRQIQITDIKGNLVFEKEDSNLQEEIDLTFLDSGVYFLKVDNFTLVRIVKT